MEAVGREVKLFGFARRLTGKCAGIAMLTGGVVACEAGLAERKAVSRVASLLGLLQLLAVS